MIEKADEECPQILTRQFVMRITSAAKEPPEKAGGKKYAHRDVPIRPDIEIFGGVSV
jgi:hypothetical protein